MQVNYSSLDSDLGGRNHGCLGLVKTEDEYAEIPNTLPFVGPEHPPVLTMPDDSTPTQAIDLKRQHVERKVYA